jgi:predicted ester cyclase
MKQCIWVALGALVALIPAFQLTAGDPSQRPVSVVTGMSIDEQKKLSRRSLEMWTSTHTDQPEEIFAANYINHQEPDAKGGVKSVDLEGWKDIVSANHRAFSNFKVQILMQIAENDLVATRWKFSAKHTGEYLGHPPTDKQVEWTGVQIDRSENGKTVESSVDWDKYRLFEELGFLK